MKEGIKKLRPVILLFVVFNALALVLGKKMAAWGMDQTVVLIGNLLLFAVTLLSFSLAIKNLSNPNPHAFVRSISGSMLLKLFTCATAVFVYVAASDNAYNKSALFVCMGLYLVYTFLEVSILTHLLRNKTHG